MSDCSICYQEGTDCSTGCGHPFHRECLARWRRINPVCPLCRRDLTIKIDTSRFPPGLFCYGRHYSKIVFFPLE